MKAGTFPAKLHRTAKGGREQTKRKRRAQDKKRAFSKLRGKYIKGKASSTSQKKRMGGEKLAVNQGGRERLQIRGSAEEVPKELGNVKQDWRKGRRGGGKSTPIVLITCRRQQTRKEPPRKIKRKRVPPKRGGGGGGYTHSPSI